MPSTYFTASKKRRPVLKTIYSPFSLLIVCVLLSSLGCDGVYESTVQGTVTFDGKKLERGSVKFDPIGGGPPAYGEIDSDGTYAIRVGREESIPPGEYDVTVVSKELSSEPTKKGVPPKPGKDIVPAKYHDKKTSGLKETVNKGKNTINFDLKP